MDAELAMPPLAPGDGTAPAQGETARTPELTLPSPPEEPDYSAFQGQVVTPPPPPWQRASRETSGLPSASGPLPDFDASQGRWQQMEIGQFDRPRNAPPVGSGPGADGAQGLFPADTGVSAQTAQVSSPGQAAPGDQATPAAQSNQGGDPFVRELFSEYLTETLESNPPQNEPEPAQPAQQTQQAQPAQRAQAEPPAPTSAGGPLPPPGQGGGSLGELFSEFTTTDVPDNSPRPPEAPSGSGSVIIPISPPPQPGSLTAPLAPPPLPPTALAPPDDPAALPDPGEDAANLAIARAGSLLMEEGMRPRVGSAAILEPGDPAAKANGKQAPSKTAKKNERPAGKANAKANGKAAPKANAGTKKAARPRAAAPARPNLSVMVVNETGRPQVGEDYRLVLSRMGYKVVSVTERSPSGQGGGTVIAYRSGRQSQARALARRLPGPRQLEPSREALPAEAVVVIR
jgi:hypothetical protein